jgi:FKBP-type peptidyl-prolyl cis-trans isomerase FkpA/FKBP-type peptidyl-prolyl cis-trans isomerase FklB
MIRTSWATALLYTALLAFTGQVMAETSSGKQPKTETDKTLYAIGMMLAANMADFNLTEDEMAMVSAGLQDGVLGAEPKVDVAAYGPKVQEFVAQRAAASATEEKQKAAAFVESMAATDGAVTTSSGLVFIDLVAGEGDSPAATNTVTVHYHGTLSDGTVFDSSVERGEPASFPLNRVIPCWTEGLQLMKPGGKARLVCPSDIAYGDRGSPPTIKPGAALVFEVELLSVE